MEVYFLFFFLIWSFLWIGFEEWEVNILIFKGFLFMCLILIGFIFRFIDLFIFSFMLVVVFFRFLLYLVVVWVLRRRFEGMSYYFGEILRLSLIWVLLMVSWNYWMFIEMFVYLMVFLINMRNLCWIFFIFFDEVKMDNLVFIWVLRM